MKYKYEVFSRLTSDFKPGSFEESEMFKSYDEAGFEFIQLILPIQNKDNAIHSSQRLFNIFQ